LPVVEAVLVALVVPSGFVVLVQADLEVVDLVPDAQRPNPWHRVLGGVVLAARPILVAAAAAVDQMVVLVE
jgi:hypothetical protein